MILYQRDLKISFANAIYALKKHSGSHIVNIQQVLDIVTIFVLSCELKKEQLRPSVSAQGSW